MITEETLEKMDALARGLGFGRSDDYPHLGQSSISAGDWKGFGHCCMRLRRHRTRKPVGGGVHGPAERR